MKKVNFKVMIMTLILVIAMLTSCTAIRKDGGEEQSKADESKTSVSETATTTAKALKPVMGGTVNLAMQKPDTLNILDNTVKDVSNVLGLVYEPLFLLDEKSRPTPILAKSYEYDESGRGLVIKLKENIKFHDGSVLTSNDVKYSIEYIKTNPESPYNFYVLPIRRVSIIDENTFKLYYDEPYAFAVSDLIFPIISKNYRRSKSYDKFSPVGTGPYMLDRFETTKFLDLKVFPEYREEVLIEKVHAAIVNDGKEIEDMFNAGLVDIYAPRVFNWLDYSEDNYKRIKSYVSRNMTFIGYNFDKEAKLGRDVRKAITRTVDRKHIAYKAYVSKVYMAFTPILPEAYFNGPDSIAYDNDIEKSKELLVEYNEENPLKISLLINSDVANSEWVAKMIKDNLAKINIELSIDSKPRDEYLAKVKSGDYEMFLGNLKMSSRPDYYSLFHSEGSQNFIKYKNPLMDEYIAKLINSTKEEEIKASVNDIENTFLSDLPYTVLFFHSGGILINDKLKGNYKVYNDDVYFGIRNLHIEEK